MGQVDRRLSRFGENPDAKKQVADFVVGHKDFKACYLPDQMVMAGDTISTLTMGYDTFIDSHAVYLNRIITLRRDTVLRYQEELRVGFHDGQPVPIPLVVYRYEGEQQSGWIAFLAVKSPNKLP